MRKPKDISGKEFGRLLVLRFAGYSSGNRPRVLFECSCKCGAILTVRAEDLKSGNTNSCGCYQLDRIRETNKGKVSQYKTATYRSWKNIRTRCYCEGSHDYPNYGGRGVKVCDRWLASYDNFIQDMGPRPPKHSIDRIDVNGDYEPGNCRWSLNKEQTRNKRNNRYLTVDGQTKTIAEWSEISGIKYTTIRMRLNRGLNPLTPVPKGTKDR